MTKSIKASCRLVAQYDLGPVLRRTAHAIGIAVAAVYVAGMALGWAVHWLNDQLAGRPRAVAPQRPRPAATAAPVAPVSVTGFPVTAPAPAAEPTVQQLRRMARARGHHGKRIRDARRAELLELLAA